MGETYVASSGAITTSHAFIRRYLGLHEKQVPRDKQVPREKQVLKLLELLGTRTNARASHTKLRTRKCPNFPKLAYAFAKKYHAK